MRRIKIVDKLEAVKDADLAIEVVFEKFEGKLEEFSGNMPRAVVELAKEWRTDKILRRLEAMLARSLRAVLNCTR